MLALFSGLLFAWAFIGIELPLTAAKEGITLFGANVIIKSPQAVPFVLLSLIAYFTYRLVVEWNLVDEISRAERWCRIDFWIAAGLAGAAVLVYAVQWITNIQLADYVVPSQGGSIIEFIGIVIFASAIPGFVAGMIRQRASLGWFAITIFGVPLAVSLFYFVYRIIGWAKLGPSTPEWAAVTFAGIVGLSLSVVLILNSGIVLRILDILTKGTIGEMQMRKQMQRDSALNK